jgi:ribosome-binding protein aMBF1 (putative translation factor)
MPAYGPAGDHAAGFEALLCTPHHKNAANTEVRVVSREAARAGAAGDAHESVSIMATENAREREKRIIGANIKRYREARGWTQEELAAATQVHRTQIPRWEHGVWKPDPDHMERLAKMLGVTLADFYNEEIAA